MSEGFSSGRPIARNRGAFLFGVYMEAMTRGFTIKQMRELNRKPKPTAEEARLILMLAQAREQGWVSTAGPEMRHGAWDHFKGGVYISTQVVMNVDSQEAQEPMVIYCSATYGTWFARRCEEWNELVEWPDGKYRSRFVLRKDASLAPEFKVCNAMV